MDGATVAGQAPVAGVIDEAQLPDLVASAVFDDEKTKRRVGVGEHSILALGQPLRRSGSDGLTKHLGSACDVRRVIEAAVVVRERSRRTDDRKQLLDAGGVGGSGR